jgi:protein-tyrosine phosphatase
MVCLGNICRSPLAEGILKEKCKAHGLDWEIDSAGTGKWHIGSNPDRRSVAVAKKHGIDISSQRGRGVDGSDYEYFDIIYAMDTMIYKDLKSWALDAKEEEKVKLILSEIENFYTDNIPDPYLNDSGFDEVYDMLDKACEEIIKKYK